jgi:muramoyltetrapeptide carboxypeptidase LdcA involved in peptidoglycan recycling
MPVQYEEPIIYNLAVRLAPEFGKTVSREVALTAMNSYNRITTLNSANYVEPVKIVLPVSASGGYSINSDSYR